MYCEDCSKLVGRTGHDSDGFGIFRHEPCGFKTEFDLVDPRVQGVIL